MKRGRVEAVAVTLHAEDGHAVARGVVVIDDAEGPPPAIFWQGELYLKECRARYVKRRAMYGDGSFQAVRK